MWRDCMMNQGDKEKKDREVRVKFQKVWGNQNTGVRKRVPNM